MPPSTADTRARAAVAGVFLTNGALYASVVPRLPEIKAGLELSNAALGTAIAASPLGALVAGLFAPALINRLRSSRVAALGIVALAVAVVAIGLAPGWPALALAMFAAGALDSVVDVAQNTHGLRVQRRYGRSIVNSFHGLWSIGAVSGGLLGSAAAGLAVPLAAHLISAAVLFSVIAVVCYRFMLPGPDDSERAPSIHASGRVWWPLVALGVLAACGALVEDSGSSWSAIYLSGSLGAGAAVAGLGFVCLQTAMTVGRMLGDRVTDRFGQRRVVRWGGVLAAVGMGLALAVPSVGTTLVGFTLAGLGTATLVPAAMHSADELPGLASGVGLTVVSWMLRIGSLVAPPVTGLVADAISLRVGLLSVVFAGVVVWLLGRTLANSPTHH
ncbi:MFS transporter [Actinokineospora globicatena]|uniref:MFS transporter n=1 Tax=Actinokineospora globicatena TaxID=103729 RepID=UPI0020A263F1|nr:MFS transporter [Actinokineospora globicatena]MCP2306893.1 Fucose permease [Actinokineospora globicatena]GLW82336.1 MFS transporter [Actinokineospora globicatena]GLW89071.1 MFS transporter [Actinokineospora globicatena]